MSATCNTFQDLPKPSLLHGASQCSQALYSICHRSHGSKPRPPGHHMLGRARPHSPSRTRPGWEAGRTGSGRHGCRAHRTSQCHWPVKCTNPWLSWSIGKGMAACRCQSLVAGVVAGCTVVSNAPDIKTPTLRLPGPALLYSLYACFAIPSSKLDCMLGDISLPHH